LKPIEAVSALSAAFQKELTPETITIYESAFSDIEPALLAESVREAIATSKFFPAVAEIRRAAARLSGILPPPAAEILGIIRRADTRDWDWHPQGSRLRHSWKWPEGIDAKTLQICESITRMIGIPCDDDGEDLFGWEQDVRKACESELPAFEARALLNLSSARLLASGETQRLTP